LISSGSSGHSAAGAGIWNDIGGGNMDEGVFDWVIDQQLPMFFRIPWADFQRYIRCLIMRMWFKMYGWTYKPKWIIFDHAVIGI
jgi:hypothetical protein